MSVFQSTTLSSAGIDPESDLAPAIATRRTIFEMSDAAEAAVLRPRDFGAFDHGQRAAIAARVSNLAGDETLASHYLGDAGDWAELANPAENGASHGLEAVLTFVDKVANQTRDIAPEDVSSLQAAGVLDADIVRLCELVAFLAYQARVIDGLRLMQGRGS